MNLEEINDEMRYLNQVSITSDVRAPGEYKYYYCGEQNDSSDKSFLKLSTMWYNGKINEDMILLSSSCNSTHTCQLYLNITKYIYEIFIYQNYIDYTSENINMKIIKHMRLNHSITDLNIKEELSKCEEGSTELAEKIKVKIFFASNNFLIINEFEKSILLIDFNSNEFLTIFKKLASKGKKQSQNVFGVIDTYDEHYLVNGVKKKKTYVFIYEKTGEKKNASYQYKYFMLDKNNLKCEQLYLFPINLDLGNSEPLGLKIVKIPNQKKDIVIPFNEKWFYIICFASSTKLFQVVTDYNSYNLHKLLNTQNWCENQSNFINSQKISISNTEMSKNIRIFLNINTKTLCAFIMFMEFGFIESLFFDYQSSPEEIRNNIFIKSEKSELPIDTNKKKQLKDSFGDKGCCYEFDDKYIFKANTVCAIFNKNLYVANKSRINIYDLEEKITLNKYDFYKETISTFLLFEGISSIFLLTQNKLFKIIDNKRYDLFDIGKIILQNPDKKIKMYDSKRSIPIINNDQKDEKLFDEKSKDSKKNQNLDKKEVYPTFEYQPEDIWKTYADRIKEFKENSNKKYEKNLKKDEKLKNDEMHCVLCTKQGNKVCGDCGMRYYCSEEHFKRDFYNFHFFECQLFQFFKREDIISIENDELKYAILYNELIKLCGRILNYIFTRIFCDKDCHYFLEMIITLIKILDNFGFNINFNDYYSANLMKKSGKPEKALFYQECIFFYIQLQMLKCTFALKAKLYNLTDCYIRIIKNDLIPKLTLKTYQIKQGKYINSFNVKCECEKLKKELLNNGNSCFIYFDSNLFFDIEKYLQGPGADIDIVENFVIKHLMTLSLLVKFKIKINSLIEITDSFIDIALIFDEHFNKKYLKERKVSASVTYCYFSISFYLVEIGKVPNTVKLFKRMTNTFTEKSDSMLKVLTYYNLGILQYALGDFKIGVHNIETAYKLVVDLHLPEKLKYKMIDSLGLAYLNQRNLLKSYILIQNLIKELKKITKEQNEIRCITLYVYLNYIIDLYEYSFITKERMNISNKVETKSKTELIRFVEGDESKELMTCEQNVSEFLKVVEFVWKLAESDEKDKDKTHEKDILKQLNECNLPKKLNRDDYHHERNFSFNFDTSQASTTSIFAKEMGIEKDELQEEYDDDIEVKPEIYNQLPKQQQKYFQELKTNYLKRELILRDPLGAIEKFNINYDPVYSIEFMKIAEKLKSNYLLKEIFYCFQNEKWRDELYNYSPNNILFGLSKYLKMDKIQNMIAIERSKCLDKIRKEKEERYKSKEKNKNNDDAEYIFSPNLNKNPRMEMSYKKFKKKFTEELLKKEKNKDLLKYLNLDEDYLINLFANVYQNNPNHDFIFKNPLLILNYIFVDINNDENYKKNILKLKEEQYIYDEQSESSKTKIKNSDSENVDSEVSNNTIVSVSKNESEIKSSNDDYDEENSSVLDRQKINKLKQNLNLINDIKKESKEINSKYEPLTPQVNFKTILNNKLRNEVKSLTQLNLQNYRSEKSVEKLDNQEEEYSDSGEINNRHNKYISDEIVDFYEDEEDNIQICSKECEYEYKFFHRRKKDRTITRDVFTANMFNFNMSAAPKESRLGRKSSAVKSINFLFQKMKRGSLNFVNPNKMNSKELDTISEKKFTKKDSIIEISKSENSSESKTISLDMKPKKSSGTDTWDNNKLKSSSMSNIENEKKNDDENDNEYEKQKTKEKINENEVKSNQESSTENNLIQNINEVFDKNKIEHVSNKKEEKKNDTNPINIENNTINNESDNSYNNDSSNIKSNDNVINNENTNNTNDKNSNNINNINNNNDINYINNINSINNDVNSINNDVSKVNNNINKINNDINSNSNKKHKKLIKDNSMKLLEVKSKYDFLFEDELKKIKNKNNKNTKNKTSQKKITKNNSTINFNKQKTYTKFKSIEFNSQNKTAKKYPYKNKEEQEREILYGAIEYLQNDYKNKNNKNRNNNNINIPLSLAKTSYNEKKNNYKVPYDYKKKGKNFGEDSTISLNSTSSEPQIIIVNNNLINEKQRVCNLNKKNTKNNNYLNNASKLQKSSSQKNFNLSDNKKVLNKNNSCKILRPIMQNTNKEDKQKLNFNENKNRHFKELPKNKEDEIENSQFKSVLDKYFKCLKRKNNISTNNIIIENCNETENIIKEENNEESSTLIKKNNNEEKNNLKEYVKNSQKNNNISKKQSNDNSKSSNLKNNTSFIQEKSFNSSDFLDNDSGFRERYFNKPNADSALIVNINKFKDKNVFCSNNSNEKIKKQSNNDELKSEISYPKNNENLPVFNDDRLKNILLIFNKIKIKPEFIINALINFNDNVLSNNICDMILSILPDEIEIQKINNIKENKSKYTECEKFMKMLTEISYYKERLLSIKFKNSFHENYKNINFEIDKTLNVIRSFSKDKNIKKWIEIILGFKDYITDNSEKGFSLNLLEKILETKTNDNKKNLLFFIVEWIFDKKETKIIEINISYVKNSMSINELEKTFNELKSNFNNNVNVLKQNVFSEKCILFLESFYGKTEKSLKAIENKIYNVKKEYKEMIKIFGENNVEWDKFFGEFIKFFDNVKTAAEIFKKMNQ